MTAKLPDAGRGTTSFERIISDASARFLQADAAQIDAEIEHALAAIGGWLEVDRCFTFLAGANRREHRVRHVWTGAGIAADEEVVGQVMQQAFPWVGEKMLRHEDVVVDRLEDLPDEAWRELGYCHERGIQSFLMCPMYSASTVVGNIGVDSVRQQRVWTDEVRSRLRLLGEIIANAILRQQKDRQITLLTERLETENAYLRGRIEVLHSHEEIVGESPAIKSMLAMVEQVAVTDANVLVLGETGTGKELLARAIHRLSKRSGKILIAVNCAALSPTLIESELFGREKGAYTGAISKQIGRFEAAEGSSIFLDEIGELPLEVQAKLLRVLQNGEFERLGSTRTIRADVRLIAATNRDLENAVRDGTFREDLFYRLNVFPIRVPTLRERKEDIPLLVWSFVKELEKSMGQRIRHVSKTDLQALSRCAWNGNVRELRNVVERGMILSRDGRLRLVCPAAPAETSDGNAPETLLEIEQAHILSVLERVGWRVRGAHGAAHILGLKPTTLESRMKKLQIRRP